jgi:hypothetical protein
MSQTSALPVRNTRSAVALWRSGEQLAHPGNMVADMLILIALAAAPTAETGSRTSVEVRVTATIQRGITLQDGTASTRATELSPIRQKPRDCRPADKAEPLAAPDCHLIVYDLP